MELDGVKSNYEIGVWYYWQHNYEIAIYYFKSAYDVDKNIDALCMLGYIYEHGEGVDVNFNEAIKYYKLAACHGDIIGIHGIAFMYYYDGDNQNYDESFKWFKIGADEHNDNDLQYMVGVMYEHGFGIKKDINMAIKYYTTGSNNGNEECINKLAEINVGNQ